MLELKFAGLFARPRLSFEMEFLMSDAKSGVTLVPNAIHNPVEPRHFMRLQPVFERVRISLGRTLLAESLKAIRVVEIGRDVYPPVLYLDRDDMAARLRRRSETTHCPLKGDASYFDVLDQGGELLLEKGAWSYEAPIEAASELAGRIAFYPDGLTFELSPAPS